MNIRYRTVITAFSSAVLFAASLHTNVAFAAGHLAAPATFADISWGTAEDAVKTALNDKGYAFDTEKSAADPDHDLWFKGTIQGQDAEIIAQFDPQRRLVRTLIDILTPDADCAATYRTIHDGLVAKYGEPSSDMAYTGPADGFDEAVKSQKSTVYTVWAGSDNASYDLTVQIDKSLIVELFYESPAWNDEMRRRNSTPDRNL